MSATRQLRSGDAKAALAFAAELASCGEAVQLDAQIESLPGLIGAESVVVTDCRDWAGEVVLEVGDPSVYRLDLLGAVAQGWQGHPVLTRDLAEAASGARRISDFVSAREWERTELFNDFYRPLGMTRELSTQLTWGPAGASCCLVLHRAGRDFSERDRALLEHLGPHLRAARQRIATEGFRKRRLALLERGLEGTGTGAFLLTPDRRLSVVGVNARDLLQRWFGHRSQTLPGSLAAWWATERVELKPRAFEIVRGERRLGARLLAGEDEDLILLSERDGAQPSAPQLARLLPITAREAEVLARLAAGRTNEGIAADLAISRHTVVRHLERVYAKLGVRTRVSATRVALETLRADA